MKSWKYAIAGVPIVIVGIAAFSFKWGCQTHVDITIEDTPPTHLMGWSEEASELPATRQMVAEMPEFVVIPEAPGVKKNNITSNVRFWEFSERAGIDCNKWLSRQEVGDCVSWGMAKSANWLQVIQIQLGQRAEFREIYPPYIYGTSRVQIGGGRLSGDGSVGAWAAKAVQQYGVIALDAEGVPRYSGQIAREWGRRGPPAKFLELGKETLIKTASPMRSAQDCCDAICNGYPVTIASNAGFGRITERDGRMVGQWTTSWAHQMHLCGYDGTASSGKRYFYCLNSWGHNAHPRPLQGEPPGGFWITWEDLDRITRQGDSFAYSSFEGFPSQNLPDFVIFQTGPNKPKKGGNDASRDMAM